MTRRFSGQTGAGKTYTMQGPANPMFGVEEQQEKQNMTNHAQRGIIPRAFEYLFAAISRQEKQHQDRTYLCRATYLEIYNELVYDLLNPASQPCSIREDLKDGVKVEGCTEQVVTNAEEAWAILQKGMQNRHIASTSMNRESSRSHSFFTLSIQSRSMRKGIMDVREAKFNLIDLAGSERQKFSKTSGDRLKEAGNINKSLLALGNVINALVDVSKGKPRHVQYRDSKLTFLLRV